MKERDYVVEIIEQRDTLLRILFKLKDKLYEQPDYLTTELIDILNEVEELQKYINEEPGANDETR